MVSNLILRGYGVNSHIITRGFGPITVTVQPPVLVPQPSGGGLVIPREAIAIAEIKIKVLHLQPFVRQFRIRVKHIDTLTRIPIKIKRVTLFIKTAVTELILESFVRRLNLNIRTGGLEVNENKS